MDYSYRKGFRSVQDPQLANMQVLLESSREELDMLIGIIKDKARGAPIYKLPSEVMRVVFKLFDTDDLLRCRQVCQDWRQILDSKTIWQAAPVVLSGTLKQIDTKWENLLKLTPSPSILFFNLLERPGHFVARDATYSRQLIRLFEGLHQCSYESICNEAAEFIWYHYIMRCASLKVLHWKSGYASIFPSGREFPLNAFAMPLESCRLEELTFDKHCEVHMYECFLQVLGKLKRLHHIRGLSRSDLLAVLSAAEDHLEEVYISGVGSRDVWNAEIAAKESLSLSNVRQLTFLDVKIGVLPIDAPKVGFIRLGHGELINTMLLDSCRHHLKVLHIETRGVKIKETLGRELFDMPCLEELSLNYTREEGGEQLTFWDYSTAALWHVVEGKMLTTTKVMFPRLKRLKITHDPLLDERMILKYLEIRSLLEQPRLEQMQIHLANNCSDSMERLYALGASEPGYKFWRFDHWDVGKTSEWALVKALFLYGWTNDEDGESVKICKNRLKELSVRLEEWKEENSLKFELFNMPELEYLELDFETCDGGSATALWNVGIEEETGTPGVSPQDILPKLKQLVVKNDSFLDEERIIKFVEMRQRLGMPPLEYMEIHLTKACSKSTSRLELLKRRMRGFNFESGK
jgi:hypothetical protein